MAGCNAWNLCGDTLGGRAGCRLTFGAGVWNIVDSGLTIEFAQAINPQASVLLGLRPETDGRPLSARRTPGQCDGCGVYRSSRHLAATAYLWRTMAVAAAGFGDFRRLQAGWIVSAFQIGAVRGIAASLWCVVDQLGCT